jgi:hypothetical protein
VSEAAKEDSSLASSFENIKYNLRSLFRVVGLIMVSRVGCCGALDHDKRTT